MQTNTVMDAVLGMLGREAEIDHLNADTQRIQQTVNLEKQKLDSEVKKDQMLAQFSAQQANTAQTERPITKDDNPLSVYDDRIKDFKYQIDQNTNLGNRYKSIGAWKEAMELDKDNASLRTNIRNTQLDKTKAMVDQRKELGGIASSITDEGSFNAGFPLMKQVDPSLGTKGSWDRNQQTGEVEWGPKTAASMKMYGDKTVDEAKKLDIGIKQANAETNAINSATRASLAASTALVNDARVAHMQNEDALIKERTRTLAEHKSAAKMKASRPATTADKATAQDTILGSGDFGTFEDWNPQSLQSFRSDVAALGNDIVAAAADKGERMSYDEAYATAFDRLKDGAEEKPTGAKEHFWSDPKNNWVYRRPGEISQKGKISTGTGKDKTSGTTDAPKNAKEYLKSRGVE